MDNVLGVENLQKPTVRSYKDLLCYKKSFELAMEMFRLTCKFPKEERYSLIDQLRRSSRSIPANIAEGWAKRKYENVFKKHLIDAVGSAEEVKVWLDISVECGYVETIKRDYFIESCEEISRMLNSLVNKWQSYD